MVHCEGVRPPRAVSSFSAPGCLFLSITLAVIVWPTSAAAETVLARRSHWNRSGSRIYTTTVSLADDGSLRTHRVLGGVVGDIGMRVYALSPFVGWVQERSQESGAVLRWKND